MADLSALTDFSQQPASVGNTDISIAPDTTSAPQSDPNMSDNIANRLLGLNGVERYQTWPEKLVRDALNAPHDVMTGKVPQYQVDQNTGEVSSSSDMIKPAMAMAAVAGTGGLAGVGEDAGAALGSAPFLRPALKYEGKIYKAPMRPDAQHLDAIPDSLYPEFQKQAMSGEDISNFNFGFMNHKGQFLNREDALDYAIKEGLLNPNSEAARAGTLTSSMGLDKPNDFLPAVKDLNTNKIYSGDKYSNHPSLKYQDNKFLNNTSEGFADKSGNFLTRNEFNNKFGINESSELQKVLMSDPHTALVSQMLSPNNQEQK